MVSAAPLTDFSSVPCGTAPDGLLLAASLVGFLVCRPWAQRRASGSGRVECRQPKATPFEARPPRGTAQQRVHPQQVGGPAGEALRTRKGADGGGRSSPEVMQWNQAIDSAAKALNLDLAEELLEEMESKDVEPDVVSFNSVIHACAKSGATARAEKWLANMKGRKVDANVVTHNILMDAYAKADDAHGAETCLRRMLNAGVKPNVVSYATVIRARAKRGEMGAAEQWFQK